MRARRYRLTFWPLFIGIVTYSIAGKGGSPWRSLLIGTGVALYVLGLVYSSDKTRPLNGVLRVLMLLVSVIATAYWIALGSWLLYVFATLFLLIAVLILFWQDLSLRLHKERSIGANH